MCRECTIAYDKVLNAFVFYLVHSETLTTGFVSL